MVHSVELLFDAETEAAIGHSWDELRAAGLPAQVRVARPHVTLVVADHLDSAVRQALTVLLDRFPLPCRVGSALIFGRSAAVLARVIVPGAHLLQLHADVHRVVIPHSSAVLPHTEPGDWTPHVTLGRRIPADGLATALRIAGSPAEIAGSFVGLRYWDGDSRTEHVVS